MQLTEFVVSSTLSAAPQLLWNHAVSPEGVNREFQPLMRMSFPRDTGDLTASWRPGKRVFRSWLFLGGVFPLEYDDVAFAEVETGRRFLERSSMLTQRLWEHERVIEPLPHGCRLTDRVYFVPRVAWLAPLYAPIFKAVFRLRHRNLRRLFGEAAAGAHTAAAGS